MSDPVRRRRDDADGGFALVEYVLTVGIMGLIMAVLTAAMVVVLRNQKSSEERNDASNGSLGLTNYFPTDVASTPPGGRETSATLDTGCNGYEDKGHNVVRLTWSEQISGSTTQYRVAYRLVPSGSGAELHRISCVATGGSFGSGSMRRVAFALAAVPKPWVAGTAPAALTPLSGDGPVTLTLTAANATTYTVQGTRLNPASFFAPYAPPAPNAAIETTFTLAVANYSTVGQSLAYTVTISNTGAVPLTGVGSALTNATVGTACATTLAAGITTTCTATHTVTQAELDAGTITAGIGVYGYYGSATVTATTTNTITAAAAPSVAVLLTSSSPGYTAVGDVISYEMTITNNGNITLVGLAPSYSNASATGACTTSTLAPGASTTCTADHAVTAGEYGSAVSNSGTAVGSTAAWGDTPPASSPDVEIPFLALPALAITDLAASPSPFSAAGETITFTVTLENTGNVDLSGVSVAHKEATVATSCASTLAIGTTTTCTATYVTQQSDVDAGGFDEAVDVEGTYFATTVTGTATVFVPVISTPGLSVLLATSATSFDTVGEVIPFTLSVTNTGTATLTALTAAFSNATPAGACSPIPLAPGATAMCAATRTVVAADLGNPITTTATATGSTGSLGNAGPETSAPISVAFLADPQLSITSFTASPSPFTSTGQVVTFTVTIENTGNVALSSLNVAYDNASATTGCTSSLAVGATTTCTATHTTTVTDSATGIVNTVTANANYGGAPRTAQSSLTVPSAQPCSVTSPTSGGIANPTSVGRVPNNSNGKKDMLLANIAMSLTTAGTCTNLRIKYFPKSPSSVVAELVMVSPTSWTFVIPGESGTNPSTWSSGAKQIQVLPASSVGSTPIFTNTAAFTVT